MEVDLVRYGLKEPYFDLKKGTESWVDAFVLSHILT